MKIIPTIFALAWMALAGSAAWGQTPAASEASPPSKVRAPGVYVDSLRADRLAGKAEGDGFVDVYLYGGNSGSHVARDGPGPLVFHRKGVLVKDRRWSVGISPPLKDVDDYYQVNLDQKWEDGRTESEHAQNGLNLFRVNTGPDHGTEVFAVFKDETLAFAGRGKSLLAIDGYAGNTASVTVVVRHETTEILRTTVPVTNGEWEAGKDMAIGSGTYAVEVYGDDGKLLTEGKMVAPVNHATLDEGSLKQSISVPGEKCAITGTASATVMACLLSPAYTGKTDFNSLVHQARSFRPDQSGPHLVVCAPNLAPPSAAPKFRIPLITKGPMGMQPGEYRLLLMEGTSAHDVLATGTFVLTP